MAKLKYCNRVRSIVLGVNEKSSDRIISDIRMVSPLVNDKGNSIINKNVKKRTLSKQNRGTRNRY